MSVVIIKYNAGNVFSVHSALKRLGVEAIVTDDQQIIKTADKVIFPGVGQANSTMHYLRENKLDVLIKNLTQPVLGVCVGMQLMCRSSEEGNVDCLNIFDVPVKRFEATAEYRKIPHMGWNTIQNVSKTLFSPSLENQYVYFVHSYYVPVNAYTVATTQYAQSFSAAIQKDNFYATQFHVEKSGSVGELILNNFLEL